jgi:Protein of unknown function (DUF2911)
VQRLLSGIAVGLFVASSAYAQKTVDLKTGGGGSPHVRTEWTIDGANISIEYGRPFLKGRTIGKEVAPYGAEWRTGADAATIITTDKALKFGAVSLAPGSYTINTLPTEKQWTLILGRLGKPGQWGIPYQKDLEIGRTPMTLGATKAPVENVTISIDDTPAGATLRVEWGTTSATAPFTVG